MLKRYTRVIHVKYSVSTRQDGAKDTVSGEGATRGNAVPRHRSQFGDAAFVDNVLYKQRIRVERPGCMRPDRVRYLQGSELDMRISTGKCTKRNRCVDE